MGPKEIRKLSTTKVITADTYDDDGFPIVTPTEKGIQIFMDNFTEV